MENKWPNCIIDETAKIADDVMIGAGAIIGPKVEIGEGTKVWHYANVLRGARIGRNVMIGFVCQVDPACVIGDGTRIQPYTVVGGGSIVGRDVFLGPYTCLTNAGYPPSSERLKGVHIEDEVVLNTGTVVLAAVNVGRRSISGARSLITRDVPPESEVRGMPARVVGRREDYDKRQARWNKQA